MAKKNATSPVQSVAPAATEATKPVATETVNRSEKIRQYHAANPNAKHSDIAKALTTDGMEVSASLVSSVLGNRRKKTNGGMDVNTIKLAAAFVKYYKGKVEDAAADIETVGQFIDACGGSENALAALNTFRDISEALTSEPTSEVA